MEVDISLRETFTYAIVIDHVTSIAVETCSTWGGSEFFFFVFFFFLN